ncbi:hypothetical protein D3C75_898800 [compost metagenome]
MEKATGARIMPRISRWALPFVSVFGRYLMPSVIPTIPIGTLIRKIQCQLTYSTSHPDKTGPSAGASSMGIPSRPMIDPLRSGGASLKTIAIPIGATIPPPSP